MKCTNCQKSLIGKYCSNCGQARITKDDLTIKHFITQSFKAITEADSRTLSSFRKLMFCPGELTRAYIQGQRTNQLSPFRLFIIFSALFFLWSSKIFVTITVGNVGESYYQIESALRFVLLVPAFALICSILMRTMNLPFGAYLTFALHYYSFDFALSSIFAIPLFFMQKATQLRVIEPVLYCILTCLIIYVVIALCRTFRISKLKASLFGFLLIFVDLQFTSAVQFMSVYIIENSKMG